MSMSSKKTGYKKPNNVKVIPKIPTKTLVKTSTKTKEESDIDSDVDIEFDDESPEHKSSDDDGQVLVPSVDPDALDKAMLAKQFENTSEDEYQSEEESSIKNIIGNKAKLREIMRTSKKEDDDPPAEEEKRSKKSGKMPAIKKGPGRPRKTPKKEPIPRKGILKTPVSPDSFMEFLYDQPIVMKKIFQFFKAIAAAQVQILFRPKDIIFYAVDHLEKSKIRVRVDANKLNNYYCRDVLDVGISTREMELILNKVDKEYSDIILMSDVGSTQRNITLVLENDIQIDEMHRIELIGQYEKMENEAVFVNEDYTIKFEFPSKYFKKTVNDIKTMSLQLSITQEDANSPIVFEYLTENKRIQSKHTVRDGKKIKLESNLAEDKSFRVDIRIDYIKPIAASQIADEIRILVDENKAFMTIAYIDNGTIEIKTLTEIIDERPEDDD